MQTTLVFSHWAAVLLQQPNRPLPHSEAMLADSHNIPLHVLFNLINPVFFLFYFFFSLFFLLLSFSLFYNAKNMSSQSRENQELDKEGPLLQSESPDPTLIQAVVLKPE